MLRNNSRDYPTRVVDSHNNLASQFQNVINFIDWSQKEGQILCRFEELLEKQIRITKQELSIAITSLKIDHQMSKFLFKMTEQIDNNLNLFFENTHMLSSYQTNLQTKALNKVNLLTRNSSEHVRCICDCVIFLHFGSCNMDQYNKIIHWFEKKNMYTRLTQWRDNTLCNVKQKVFTVISIIYIKYGSIVFQADVVKSAIMEREIYIALQSTKPTQPKIRRQTTFNINQLSFESQAVALEKKQKKTQENNLNRKYAFESLTIYFRLKLIESFMSDLKLQFLQNSAAEGQKKAKNESHRSQRYYEVLILIYQYMKQVKVKVATTPQMKSIIQTFQIKMSLYEQKCLKFVKKIDELDYEEPESRDQKIRNQINNWQLFKKKKVKVYEKLQQDIQKEQQIMSPIGGSKTQTQNAFQDDPSMLQDKQNNKLVSNELSKKFMSNKQLSKSNRSRSDLVNRKTKTLEKPKVNLQYELDELFFGGNGIDSDSSRNKSKSAKAFLRDRSKSKIMAKILANTFQNAKNALRKIEFEIKTNNCDRFMTPTTEEKGKLVKKKRQRINFYQEFNNNQISGIDMNAKKIIQEVEENFKKLVIWNQISKIEQNKKCIIQHKTIHKDHQTQVFTGTQFKKDEYQSHSDVQIKLQFVKMIGGIPQLIRIKIQPVDKIYVLKLQCKPFDEQEEIDIEISLPKSNNIYAGRYKTIWPTIKHLLRKKVMQHPLFKEYQKYFPDWRQVQKKDDKEKEQSKEKEKQCQNLKEKMTQKQKHKDELTKNSKEMKKERWKEVDHTKKHESQKQRKRSIEYQKQMLVLKHKKVSLKDKDKNKNPILENQLIKMFGQIQQQELLEISSTLQILSKLYDLFLISQSMGIGRRYEMNESWREKDVINLSKSNEEEEDRVSNGQFLLGFRQTLWFNSRKQVTIGNYLLKQRNYIIRSPESQLKNSFCFMSLVADVDNVKRIVDESNHLIFKIRIYFLGSALKSAAKNMRINQVSSNQLFTEFDQTIQIDAEQVDRHEIDLEDYIINMRKLASGLRISKNFKLRIAQICWLAFSSSEHFFSPSFYEQSFPQIRKPVQLRINSEGVVQEAFCPYKIDFHQTPVISVLQNALNLNVEEISKTSENQSYLDINNKSKHHKNSKSILNSQSAKSKARILNNLRIETIMQKQSKSNEIFQDPMEGSVRFYKPKMNEGKEGKNLKELVEIRFLTSFSQKGDWIAEMMLSSFSSRKVNRMVISAQDLYFLGFPYAEKKQNVFTQLEQIIKLLKISSGFLVSKVVIELPSKEIGNTSIDETDKNNTLRSQTEKYNQKQSQTFCKVLHESSKLSQYRSIYLNKKFKFNNSSIQQPYEIGGSVGDKGANTPMSFEKKRRCSNSSSYKKTQLRGARASTLFNNESANDLQIAKKYLLKLNEFQWYLCIVPYRFLLNPSRNKPSDKLFSKSIYCTISLKHIDLCQNSNILSGSQGLIQIEASFNQAEYSLVTIMRFNDFLLVLKTISLAYDKSLIKEINKIKKIPKTQQNYTNKETSKKNRRASIRTQDKVKRLQKFHSLTIEEQPDERDDIFNRVPSFDNQSPHRFEKKKNKKETFPSQLATKYDLKKFLLTLSISKAKNGTIENNLFLNNQINDAFCKCTECSQNSERKYEIKMSSYRFPLRVRLFHEYIQSKQSIFDVYMHSQQWEIGVGVNSGIGLGAEIEIAKIAPNDHFQLVRIRKVQCSKPLFRSKPLTQLDKPSQLTLQLSNHNNNQEDNLEERIKKQETSFLKLAQENSGHVVEEVASIKILDLIRNYALQHVEAISELQPHFYTKNTIMLTRLVSYMVDVYAKGNHDIKRKYR